MSFYKEDVYVDWIDQLASKDYVVIDNYLSSSLLNAVVRFFTDRLAEDDLKKAGIGSLGDHTINKNVRGDYVYWLSKENDDSLSEFFEQSQEFIQKIKRYCFLSISDFECHLAYYPIGTGYKKHLDQFKGRDNRILSFVLYLNENWKMGDGGELIIHEAHKEIKIAPLNNRLILFNSATVVHEVAQTNQPRKSITGWMLNNPVGLGFLG